MTYSITTRTTPHRYPERVAYDRDAAWEVLDESYVCHLGFTVDGAPRVLPTLFVRADDTLYVHGSTGSGPLLAARGPEGLPVCVTVTVIDGLVLARSQFHHSANYRSLVAYGTARLVTDMATKRKAMDALVEKIGPGRGTHTRPPTVGELAKTAVLALELSEVSVKRRAGGVSEDDEDLALPYWAGVVPLTLVHGDAIADTGVTVPAPDYIRTRSPWLEPVPLRGEHVTLEPLALDHAAELFAALDDEEAHRHMTRPRPRDIAGMAVLIDEMLRDPAAGNVSWLIRDARTGAAIGRTSYYGINEATETIAIGYTQMARSHRRTGANTETKLLLMTRAFETLGVGRVEWHVDIRNERSQDAVARLGATREGVLRRHKRRGDGTWRDTVLYAMTADEWPASRDRLFGRLAVGATG